MSAMSARALLPSGSALVSPTRVHSTSQSQYSVCPPGARAQRPDGVSEKLVKRRTLIERASHVAVLLTFSFGLPYEVASARVEALSDSELEQDEEDIAVRIFSEAAPSVVSVRILEMEGRDVTGGGVLKGTGSGIVWDEYGHIVTNYHVIAKFATDRTNRQRVQVSLLGLDGTSSLHEAELVGIEPSRDLAVLKIAAPPYRLRPLPVGSSGDLLVGQTCFAIGNPLGLDHTLTSGVVSGLQREIPSPSGKPIPGAIQTDAAINSGNSGGPLLDSSGRMIGVNTATFTRQGTGMSSGVNFAVPVDTVRRVVPTLIVFGSSGL